MMRMVAWKQSAVMSLIETAGYCCCRASSRSLATAASITDQIIDHVSKMEVRVVA